MIGFIIGTVCLIGLVKVARHGRCGGYGYGGYGGGCHGGGCHSSWGGHHHHGGWGGHGGGWGRFRGDESGAGGPGSGGAWFFEKFMLRRIFERLDTTPGQEKVIVQAVSEARDAFRSLAGEFKGSREDIAKAFSGESWDEALLGGAFAKQDEALTAARRTLTGALAKIHEALDARQRGVLAELLAQGPRSWGGFGRHAGPYRM